MSGHNKWSKIKHKKAASDAQKSRRFGKLTRLITVESKRALGNPDSPGLRAAVEKARTENMPNENIERAVSKGKHDTGVTLDAVRYEFYGPGGSAIIVEGLTDNRNRTAAEMKHLLSKLGFELASPGAASWAFTQVDNGWVPKTTVDISDADINLLTTLVDTLEEHDDVQSVFTNVS
ncbi:MAG TPA: YebC/PmpR family DNA-binding transcriptional regulator [Candidatus Paceibacterota bacterium]|jgi:YebC/PmpR family DNA-binding regulatory protein